MRSAAMSAAQRNNAASTNDTVDAAMTAAGYVRDEAGQWQKSASDAVPSLIAQARGLSTDWPHTSKVVRHKGTRKSKRAAAVEQEQGEQG